VGRVWVFQFVLLLVLLPWLNFKSKKLQYQGLAFFYFVMWCPSRLFILFKLPNIFLTALEMLHLREEYQYGISELIILDNILLSVVVLRPFFDDGSNSPAQRLWAQNVIMLLRFIMDL
jgi:hypothetical protein